MLFQPQWGGLFSLSYFWSKALNKILIIGYGDIGQRLAKRWQQHTAQIYSLGRSPAHTGGKTHHLSADLDRPLTDLALDSQDAILYYLAPPPNNGETDPRLENLLQAIKPNARPKRIIYISTSGVYGDHHGAAVDETTPPNPQTDRSLRRLHAEQSLTRWAEQHGIDSVILRVGGIYGPGRLPLQRLQQGMVILRRDLAPPTNRIHADDLAMICEAAAMAPPGHQVYNVCDMQTSTMSDYFLAVADYAGLSPPREVDWPTAERELSPAMLSYLRESRRLDNRKLLSELNIRLRYPTLKEGLASCF